MKAIKEALEAKKEHDGIIILYKQNSEFVINNKNIWFNLLFLHHIVIHTIKRNSGYLSFSLSLSL